MWDKGVGHPITALFFYRITNILFLYIHICKESRGTRIDRESIKLASQVLFNISTVFMQGLSKTK